MSFEIQKIGMNILGIESSCDETAAALLEVKGVKTHLRSNVVASQVDIHAQYGGVVPEVAARNHVLTILPVIQEALGKKKLDAIAVTAGPGLVTSLGVGVLTARTLSSLCDVPLIPVNHIEGHLYANWLECIDKKSKIVFPTLVLVVSGGHTELILMKDHGRYKKIGRTLDDAAGEAFDKVAKILDLGYPGGPALSRMAEKGDPKRFNFPRALMDARSNDFSFSGVKTSVLYCVRDLKNEKKYSRRLLPDLCASFQQAIVDVLVAKTVRAVKAHKVKSVLLGGGVVANSLLRSQMKATLERDVPGISLHIPPLKFCTDNAAMIAMAGYYLAQKNKVIPWEKLDVRGGWEL
ncbi:MAG: tRNA (adenosine(37)-N6)-threonylcarbamoyltransferase complex transferase subunit TsaD [Candidatus Uhrbacteria bacterium]|nr:tRNA (adenosine(37)-N6)-threonylcarbamoyltransferase complex transferase subunit TsaD [Candidatus Uhrbacteria bacterium]